MTCKASLREGCQRRSGGSCKSMSKGLEGRRRLKKIWNRGKGSHKRSKSMTSWRAKLVTNPLMRCSEMNLQRKKRASDICTRQLPNNSKQCAHSCRRKQGVARSKRICLGRRSDAFRRIFGASMICLKHTSQSSQTSSQR